ncbi:MAG TPA: shikimate dehydrogenase [Actinomycetota bacterium]|jgi:shikimate dehydrogenase|nr:shikimate dehydrogenase [Actinomycetota bacterium]
MDALTELIGVVGHPVRHSISPAFWEAALREAARNAAFLAFEVAPDDFGAFIEGMRVGGARGLNVTLPHKGAAFALTDERSETAESTRAVNVLVFDDQTTRGYNTDVHGVSAALADLGVELEGTSALVLGAGGAGRAAVAALRGGGAKVSVANRTADRAAATGVDVVDWAAVPEVLGDFDVVVHTTSVGLNGTGSVLDRAALDAAARGRLRAVLDVVYRPGLTPLVESARAAGLAADDGLRMLVHQAAEAWRLFFGDDAPVDVMHEAAAAAAGRT